ncbi:trypsin-like serine protease [Streptomyces sp. NPDC006208]|uniref:trypsin-like serine protease n=1 Tax=Streptomyces sp. NPDC006208 TaxID=3156734 RepID=UPI0033A1F5EE
MRISRSGGRHRRRLSRIIPAAAAALALLTGGTLAATSYAGEADGNTTPSMKAPEGVKVVEPDTADTEPQAQTRIIGGTSTSGGWMVQLLFDVYGDGNYYFTCGGTLVAPNKVLTAAHCLYDENGVRQDWGKRGAVLAGTSKLLGGPDNAEGQFVDVQRSWVRAGYGSDGNANDIALLTLSKPVSHPTLEMAKPTDTALYAQGTKGTVYGWGLTGSDENADLSSTLLKATLPIQSDIDCTENFNESLPNEPSLFQPGKMICTGPLGTGDDATGTTTCPGDSGGPLIVNNKVVGVVSWGIGTQAQACNVEGTFEVFTKVSAYSPAVRPRVDDTDVTRDGQADLFVRSTDGKGYYKKSTGKGFEARTSLTGSWSAYNVVLQADLNRDGYQDYVIRRKSDGDVYWRHRSASSSTYTDTKIADGWGTRKFIAVPGDATGDRLPDLISVDSAGKLWVYPGKGNGTFGARVGGVSGYGSFNSLRGKGDFNGDGRTDLIARGTDGSVYLLKGTGNGSAPYEAKLKVRDWAGYNAFAAPGDVTNDGKADFVARTPGGTLYLYPGTGKASGEIFATRVSIGGGYQQYNLFG